MEIVYHHRIRGQVESVHVMGMVKAFRALGHTVHIVGPPGTDVQSKINDPAKTHKSKDRFARFFDNIINTDLFPISFEIKEHLYNFFALKKLQQIKRRHNIDLIYERYALNCWAGVSFAKKRNIPIILEVNDATGIERVRRHVFEKNAAIIEKKVFRSADYLFTISSSFKRILVGKGVPQDKIGVLPNAIDAEVFDPDKYSNEIKDKLKLRNKVVVGYVGQFIYWHGLDLLLSIIPDIVKKIPDVHFLLVGSGEEFKTIKKQVSQMGLVEFVTFTGSVAYESLPYFLKAMDIGVIPDSNSYGSPMKLFEYMAMEVVPVVPDLGPVKEIVVNGENGMIFKRRNTNDFLTKLLKLMGDREYRERLATHARRTVLGRHTWAHNARAVLNTYIAI
jgi:glycosyltransferase involved in cell wall biosynthesis